MFNRSMPLSFVSLSLLCLFGVPQLASADDAYRISGPFQAANLAIYLVHGKSVEGPVPLTLQEALAKGVVQVEETGEVNDLMIENTGEEPVFVQSGEIVKGGRQDRVLVSSLVLPPRSGRVSLAAFCVEHGRWSARSGEAGDTFASAEAALPSREAKLAMKAPPSDAAGMDGDTGDRQERIWSGVAEIQSRLSASLAADVASPRSESSLQLSLENEKLTGAVEKYVTALMPLPDKETDVVGYVFAVNGKLNSADLYPSNALFRKMWAKLLRASATEAIADADATASDGAPPTADAVMAFLVTSETGAASKTAINDATVLETRDSGVAAYFETSASSPALNGWVHRNYLAK